MAATDPDARGRLTRDRDFSMFPQLPTRDPLAGAD